MDTRSFFITRPRRAALLALVAVVVLLAAACGSSSATLPPPVPAPSSGVGASGVAGAGATSGPGPTATASTAATGAASPAPSSAPAASSTPRAIRLPTGPLKPAPVASRVTVADYAIDLPVVSSDLQPPPANYPLCDVAQYLTTYRNPGQKGSVYIYAHARDGMFGPLLAAATRKDGAELIGKDATVYRDDGQRYLYRIVRVMRHATDYALADEVPASGQRLILQTSEGPYGTVPKLVIAADLVSSDQVDLAEARPVAHPRDCRPAQLIPSGEPGSSGSGAVASRVVVPDLRIDLPIVSSELLVPGNPPDYPLCDVAQYLESYHQPGSVGTAYIYAHAQPGMFLPFLEASRRAKGAELIGTRVQVFTSDGRRFDYEIFEVRPHATDYTLADDTGPDEHRLLLQTSEGPNGTVAKLQIGARLVDIQDASRSEATPAPHPRPCAPPGVILATPTPNTGQSPAP